MDRITFAPLIDLPLAVFTVALFIWHFNRWASSNDLEANVDLAARLPTARIRVITLFTAILLLCWLSNLAVWSLFALLFGIGIVIAVLGRGGIFGLQLGLWAAACIIREWSFGFPQFVLYPPNTSVNASSPNCNDGELMGRIGVATFSLRPTGNAEIDGVQVSVSSADGRMIDAGTEVTVTAYRNGRPCVSPRL